MRRFAMVLMAAMVGMLAAGLTSAFAGTGIVQEETVVFGEHTLKGRNLDLVGDADDFRPGDRYIFRSELTDAQDAVAGHLFVDCSVHFAKKDSCSQIYEIPARGTVTAEGLIPVSQLKVGGTWVLAITGGTGRVRERRGLRDGRDRRRHGQQRTHPASVAVDGDDPRVGSDEGSGGLEPLALLLRLELAPVALALLGERGDRVVVRVLA